jgi:hypothetical protein
MVPSSETCTLEQTAADGVRHYAELEEELDVTAAAAVT